LDDKSDIAAGKKVGTTNRSHCRRFYWGCGTRQGPGAAEIVGRFAVYFGITAIVIYQIAARRGA
jgi:hypothetical protein